MWYNEKWQSEYDNREPITQHELDEKRIKTLRWELGIEPDCSRSLEELEQMYKDEKGITDDEE